MIPLETIILAVGSAKVYYLQLLNALLVELKKGCTGDINNLQCILGLINALEYDIKEGVNDEITQENYVKLLKQMDGFSGSYVLDPNVVYPEVAIGLVQVNWGNISGDINAQADLMALIAGITIEKVELEYNEADITLGGYLLIREEDRPLLIGKDLVALTVNNEPIEALYNPITFLVPGFGGYLEEIDLNINLIFF